MSSRERGKTALPATLTYVGISRFPEDPKTWPDEAWSIVLRFAIPPPEQASESSAATVWFLVEAAPHERLRRGARFGLYEGPHKVADVEVLD